MAEILWLLLGPTWIVFWLIIAIRKFGENFSFSRICISNLGNTRISPNTKLFYKLSLVPSGFLMIPHVILVFQIFREINMFFAIIILILNLIGSFGWSGVGILIESSLDKKQTGHEILAGLFFAGYGVNEIIFFFWYVIQLSQGLLIIPLIYFLIWYSPIIVGLVLILWELLIKGNIIKHKNIIGDKRKFRKALSGSLNRIEYYSFIMMLAWNIGLIFLGNYYL